MDDLIYVFGHQNPDTDSICSSICYAYLKNKIDKNHTYVAVALKDVNKETRYILDYFGSTAPKVVKSLKAQVSDINLLKSDFIKETATLKHALESIEKQIGRSIPVVDEFDRLVGILSISDLVPRVLDLGDNELLKISKTPISNVIHELKLTQVDVMVRVENNNHIEGNIYVSGDFLDPQEKTRINNRDIVLCNGYDWKDFIKLCGCVIVGGINSPEKADKLKQQYSLIKEQTVMKDFEGNETSAQLYYSKKSIFELVKGLSLAIPITSAVIKEGIEYFTTYETIDDVRENMMTSKFRRFPVVNENGMIKGMISRSDLVAVNRKKAILVDHNERGQSIEGIEEMEILEIIDHHRVADVATIAPLYFRVEPVGCTCTIVAKMFEENNVDIPKELASLMLSAIISDTLLFNSPTCTFEDKRIAEKLGLIADIDIRFYGMKMITMGSVLSDESPAEVLNADRKKFMFGKYKVTISQMNTGDFDGFFKIFDKTIEEMERVCKEDGFDLFVLLVTDVVVGGTEIVAVGEAKWIVDRAFDLDPSERSRFLTGVFSRKKEIIPKLMNAAHS